MYDPRVGRWVEEDPAGLPADKNLYRYVGNAPTDATDPTGLELLAAGKVSADDLQLWLAGKGGDLTTGKGWEKPPTPIDTKIAQTPSGRWVLTPTDFDKVKDALTKAETDLKDHEPSSAERAWLNLLQGLIYTSKHFEASWWTVKAGGKFLNGKADFTVAPTTLRSVESRFINLNSPKNYYTGADVQDVLRAGIAVEKTTDISGPDVTDWFAAEIADQIALRLKEERAAARPFGMPHPIYFWGGTVFFPAAIPGYGASGVGSAMETYTSADTFFTRSKYYLSPKWIDFGSPDKGKGMNTVVLANIVLRKNQLGNIEFGTLTGLADLPRVTTEQPLAPGSHSADQFVGAGFSTVGNMTGFFHATATALEMIKFAYTHTGIDNYDPSHPHSDNYGMFAGARRADNLAAFGVGDAIGQQIKQLQSWKNGNAPTAAEVRKIIESLFDDKEALKKAINTYRGLYDGNGATAPFTLDTLTTTEYYGGFNTQSLTIPKIQNVPAYAGSLYASDYFRKVLEPAYAAYKKALEANGDVPFELDDWLRMDRENYRNPKGER